MQVKHSSRPSITDLVGGNLFTRGSKISKTVFNRKLLSMFGNMFTISHPTIIDSDGKFDLLSSSTILGICPVSLMRDGKSLAKSNKTVSTNIDNFYIVALHPLVITIVGLPALRVLIEPCISPGVLSLVV